MGIGLTRWSHYHKLTHQSVFKSRKSPGNIFMSSAEWGTVTPYKPVRGEVAIVGIGETEQTASSGRDPLAMAAEAIAAALQDAGLRPDDVDGLMVRGGMAGQFTAAAFQEHFGTSKALWVCDEGGAMTWAGTAPYEAALALRHGHASVIVNVFAVNWATQTKSGSGGGPGEYHRDEELKASLELPFGFYPQPVYFATMLQRHMYEYGTTAAQLGAIAVSSRQHANGHPGAVMRHKHLALDEYLSASPFIDPLRVTDCCLISDGAAAYVMTSAWRARDCAKLPVTVLGVAQANDLDGTFFAQHRNFTTTTQVYSAPAAYRMAGITPADIDVLAVYDPSTIAALIQIEDMGFCEKGGGGAFVEGDRLSHLRPRRNGGLPFNTHGGLLSHSYVLGISHVVELVRQLRGEAANQVQAAQIGVYGGYTGAQTSTLVLGAGI
jgi:acetyl-CoA acetyltransferase